MRKRNKAERVPWYRARNYKGNLTEAEKRQLDAFRMQPRHPAAQWDELPEEVQQYIIRIESELYDKKQEWAAIRALFFSAIGAGLLFLTYKGYLDVPAIWSYAGGVLLLVVPWFFYSREWNQNVERFHPSNGHNASEDGIRREWEFNYIVSRHQAERRDASPECG